MKQALLLIDIQNIYFTKGRYLLERPEDAAVIASKILERFRNENFPVIHVKHSFNTESYSENSEFLNDIHESVSPLPNELVVHKTMPNSFFQTNLDEYLAKEGITHLVVCGMMSHMCIDTTVRACKDRNIQVTVIEDACTTKSLSFSGKVIDAETIHKAFMASLDGMFAKVLNYEAFEKLQTN